MLVSVICVHGNLLDNLGSIHLIKEPSKHEPRSMQWAVLQCTLLLGQQVMHGQGGS